MLHVEDEVDDSESSELLPKEVSHWKHQLVVELQVVEVALAMHQSLEALLGMAAGSYSQCCTYR